MDDLFSENDLTDALTLPLRFLAQQERPYRQKELAKVLDVEGPTLVRVLDTLVVRNLVQRTEDPNDRRAKLVSVTTEGHAFLDSLTERLREVRSEIFAGVADEDIDQALRLLVQIEHNIETLICER